MLASNRILHRLLIRSMNIKRTMSLINSKAYVNGEWISSINNETFEVLNPVDQSIIGKVPDMNCDDVNLAIYAAVEAFKRFSKTTAKERSDLLRSWYNLMVKNSEELAKILTQENGKSLAESRAEIKYGNSFVEWFAEESRRINGVILQEPMLNRKLMILKQPIGVAALITPWNFPHAMITRKAGAAIAAGCTCVIKPSEDTPLTALALAQLAEEAGFPPGVMNFVTTNIKNSPQIGKLLCEHPNIRTISFTGSTAVGKILYEQSAKSMKRLALELGGNAPFIVFESANIDLAVAGAMSCKFRNTGQTCVSANRFFIHNRVFNEFLDKFLDKIARHIKMGDGTQNDVTHGPLIKQSQINMIEYLVNDAISKGAMLHCGGKILKDLGPLFYAPTVLTQVTEAMEIFHREIFGPVAIIHKFQDENEVLSEANSVNVGLAGYFYSKDLSQIFRVANKMEVGMIGVNEGLISCAEAAFGGVKESGLGREGSNHGVDDFLDIKYLCIGNIEH